MGQLPGESRPLEAGCQLGVCTGVGPCPPSSVLLPQPSHPALLKCCLSPAPLLPRRGMLSSTAS